MSTTPPAPRAIAPRDQIWYMIAGSFAALIVLNAYWFRHTPDEGMLLWAGGIWMCLNILCLDRLIRAMLAPPDQIDRRAGAIYGFLVVLGMPLLLLGVLKWGQDTGQLIAVTAGITAPLVVALLRALGSWIRAQPSRVRR
ncbi:MAG: hypothetical protein ABI743_02535 [bacterium]